MTATSDIPGELDFVEFAELPWHDVARFWSKVEQRGINECWTWRGETMPKGYGQFWLRAHTVGAHRVACALANGPSNGLHALHACDNPACVNPAHLRWGTIAENVQDRCERQRSARGSRQGKARLTEDDVRAIRARAAAGEQMAALGRSFGVTTQNICLIVDRRTWRHV